MNQELKKVEKMIQAFASEGETEIIQLYPGICLQNPTTLKNMFKTVYGTSIASHIRQHRMDYAAKLLLTSNSNIAEVARAVGYDSQSRFSAAFKEHFQVLPKDYRRKH